MELATNGSLQQLLRQQRHAHSDDDSSDAVTSERRRRHGNLTSADLVLFGVHVASGMEYIASQRVRYLCQLGELEVRPTALSRQHALDSAAAPRRTAYRASMQLVT